MIRKFISYNPYTKKLLKEFDFMTDLELKSILKNAQLGFLKNESISLSERLDKLNKMMSLLEKNMKQYSEIISSEMGKPIAQAEFEIKKAKIHCQYYKSFAEDFLKPKIIKSDANTSYIRNDPMGVIFCLTPFNFPFWLTFKPIIPTLLGGNAVLVRGSDLTPQTSLAIEDLMKSSGFDSNEYQTIFSSPSQSEQIISDSIIQGVAFTGSCQVGSIIAGLAGKYLKKSVMELGGSDPFIVRADADLRIAVDLAIKSRIQNAGQVCISGKRFLIHEDIYDDFIILLMSQIKKIKYGNPLDIETDIGPIARPEFVEKLEKQVSQSIQEGAKLIHGTGSRVPNTLFFEPTILKIINTDNILFKEEIFGPIFSIYKTKNDEEAIQIANNTSYGLASVIISKNIKEAENISKKIDAGMVFINSMQKSDSRLPFGGAKQSGYGRECGENGIKEFINQKLIYVA